MLDTNPTFADYFPTPERNTVKARPVVCIQGLGFVGAAMAVAVAKALKTDGKPAYNVIGVELPTQKGQRAITAINAGRFPFKSQDPSLDAGAARARHIERNLIATDNPAAFTLAKTVLVDVNLDLDATAGIPAVDFTVFEEALTTIGERIQPDTLVVIETTVPPGTCERVAAPCLARALAKRGFGPNATHLAHSFERVMPGKNYLNSITNFWRVYAGMDETAAEACAAFYRTVLNTEDYPLTRLPSPTSSELAKILENSYRAINIALIEEWSELATVADVDLMAIIEAIRVRPTHNNIRQPGFGVGGYCLTKDPLFASVAARQLFNLPNMAFPFSSLAVEVNKAMPMTTLAHISQMLDGNLKNKRIALLGISYREDIGDTRLSPSETFVLEARKQGADVVFHDPLVTHWTELDEEVSLELPDPVNVDVIVLGVAHPQYAAINFKTWLGDAKPIIFDACRILSPSRFNALKRMGIKIQAIGARR